MKKYITPRWEATDLGSITSFQENLIVSGDDSEDSDAVKEEKNFDSNSSLKQNSLWDEQW